MTVRWTTRLAIALLAAVLLALTFYAYPSLAGFTTLLVRTLAIVGALAIFALLIAAARKRRPGRIDLNVILVLAAIGLVGASWTQLSAKSDADKLAGEIADAGEGEIFAVLAATETETGTTVQDALELRDSVNAELEAIVADLWNEADFSAISGPEAESVAALEAMAAAAETGLAAVEAARGDIEARIADEIEAIQAIDTPLPDSARLSFVDAAIKEAEDDGAYYLQRLQLVSDRIDAAGTAASILAANQGYYHYDAVAGEVVFQEGGASLTNAANRFATALTEIDLSLEAEDTLIAGQENPAIRAEAAMRLVEGASATP